MHVMNTNNNNKEFIVKKCLKCFDSMLHSNVPQITCNMFTLSKRHAHSVTYLAHLLYLLTSVYVGEQ